MDNVHIFCDDILKIIIALLDDDGCIMLARTCHRLHNLVHHVRVIVTATDNIYEAVRSNLFVSFVYAKARKTEHAAIRMCNIDMLKYEHNHSLINKYDDYNYIAYKLCKLGVLTRVSNSNLRRRLIIHAIVCGKRELLKYMNNLCDGSEYQQGCAYGYAMIGDYDNFMLCNAQFRYDVALIGHAIIGGNQDIISITMTDDSWRQSDFELLMKNAIKNDDYVKFKREHVRRDRFIREIVRYNALNIVRKCNVSLLICEYAHYAFVANYAIGMTLEMAELLLEVTNNHIWITRLIVSARDYRLTEMLRARGLYDRELTMRSSHTEFTI